MKTETLPYNNLGEFREKLHKNSSSKTAALLDYLNRANKLNLIVIPAAFLLGRISLMGGLMPFGIALYAATLGLNLSRILIALAIIAGMLTSGATVQIYTAAVSMLLFNAMNIPFKKSVGSSLRTAITAFAGVLIPEILITYLQGFLLYDILKSLLNGFLIFALVFVFKNVLDVMGSTSKRHVLTNEEVLSIAIACALSIGGLGTWALLGISLRNILCILVILVFSYRTGAGNGAAIGVIVGTVISISSNSSPVMVSSYAFCGLLSGILRKMGKVGSCLGVLMGNAVLTFYTNGSTEVLIYLYEIIVAIILFMLIPNKVTDIVVNKFNKALADRGDKKGYSMRIKELTVEKLNKFSKAFGEMAKTFDEISETRSITEKHDITAIFDRVADRVCKDCSLCSHCWEQNFCNTYQILFKIVEKLDCKGWIEQQDIPQYFLDRCERVDDFVKAVNYTYELFKVDMVWRSRISESRGLVSQQMRSMSTIIANLAVELNTNIIFKEDIENNILLELTKKGLRNVEAVVYENKNGNYEIVLSYKGCGGKRSCIGCVEKAVSDVIGYKMVKNGSDCGLNTKTDMCSIKLVKEEIFKIVTGVARVAKDEKHVSGDNYTFLNSGDGKYIAALSDGMGTGHKACLQSKATVNLIEQFMESGFDKDTTVKLINSILVLKSNDETFATIDISVVDLYDGEVEFVKVGAAPTFIKREDYVETIRAASLPAGILSNVELELIHKNVNSGEYIVMVSDGIVDSFKSSDDSITEVQNVISQMTSKNPQKIADDLMEEALSRCKDKEPIDDMMVMVSKIWKPL
ncbi:stage II sporulation protein E, protein serine/threonine phosphatase [Ruminiclostridium papyrosolvens DSM 2782]|uniref:Stage II sporulation protein E, protein serine/threonine phosphatase n=1 Tax=Ruminiclostridium papyrosolvens DSM 2782 TaxID=588581 RepID=F1TGN9_9FIRM|nr:stage II sporulation protein E [Ruminiclostridium papyrosolvens]EGD46370.1 stage II sporulation protein E, protein serine/threonine phosphatase [Ruminiclostridium papyrosolvens DSM 2782]WES34017.1 stage II sporulation protein E [Ruminiclostridium papyrosolvens DSM 2782]